jgi:hypothetical protein
LKPRTRYQVAFFALGWLIALGVLFQLGFGSVTRFWAPISQRLTRAAQSTSDAEGDALRDVGGGSRKDYLEPMKPTLSSMSALRNPPRMLFGVYDGGFPNTFAGMEQLEEQVRYRFPIISFYSSWGDKPDQQFPTQMVESIQRMGSVALITWEPWVVDFDERRRKNLPPLAEREYATLRAIARSDYDFYLVPWAKAAAANKKPIFIRFAHEMNDPYRYPWGPQNGNRPEDFVAAWKHIHFIFQKFGATNVLWVWAPHISMPWFEFYYPGPESVDWIGVGVLNYGTIASWSRWWSFHQILEKAYPVLLKLNKPIMISEFGTVGAGGDIYEWYNQAFDHLDHTYQRGVRAVILFNQPRDATVAGYVLNWSPTQNPRAISLIASELARRSAK